METSVVINEPDQEWTHVAHLRLVCKYVTQVHIQKIQNSMFYFHNRFGV